jgi:hypothetical protein
MGNIVGDGPFQSAETVRKMFSDVPPGADPNSLKNKHITEMNEKMVNDFVNNPRSLGRWFGPVLDEIDVAFIKAFRGEDNVSAHLLDIRNEQYLEAFDKYTKDVLAAAKKELTRRSSTQLEFSPTQIPRLIYFLKRYRMPLLTKTVVITLDSLLREVPLVFTEVSFSPRRDGRCDADS